MPIYEYQCDACGERQEIMRKLADPPLKKCPLCGKPKLRKLMSATAFRLKGGGWYETDFKDEKKQKNVIKKEEAAVEKTETKADAKTDKAEKKTDKAEKTEKKTDVAAETPKTEAKPKEKEKKKSRKAAED